jgi:hypothetical protein
VNRRTTVIGAAALAVALAATLAVVLTRGPGGAVPPLRAPAYTADTAPEMRVPAAKDLPKACGVRAATVERYAPGAEKQRGTKHCGWYSQDDGDATRDRVLDVTVSAGGTNTSPSTSAAGDALRALDPAAAAAIASGRPARTVTGLGDEALYHYSPALTSRGSAAAGASLRVRVGAVVVSVAYDGRDRTGDGPDHQVPEAEAKRAVLAAASDAAHALGAPAKPVFAEPAPAGPPPVRRAPRPCDLVTASLAERLAPGAVRRRGTPPGMAADLLDTTYGRTTDTCVWDSVPTCCLGGDTDHRPERHLSVTVRSVPEWRRGAAVRLAAREYLERHYDARTGRGRTGFRAVRGLGDQAYAVYRTDQDMDGRQGGEVLFRYRNLVIQVDYTAGRDEPLPHATAIDSAYTVAAHARTTLPT